MRKNIDVMFRDTYRGGDIAKFVLAYAQQIHSAGVKYSKLQFIKAIRTKYYVGLSVAKECADYYDAQLIP